MTTPVHYHLDGFPPQKLDWLKLIPLIGPANAALARYDGTLHAIANAAVLLSPLTTHEAVLSSRIEGTQATMGEVLEYEAEGEATDMPEEKKCDIHEILNYRRAMRHAVELLKDLPLCQRVICEAHRTLLEGVRGETRAPGEYRKVPNWIGPAGCAMEEARYIPISADKLPNAMSSWERHIHEKPQDQLIQLAILHAEFEAIHPFLDGNGRLGRMFVPLFLFKTGLLSGPVFYISAFFERNRDEYYERLLTVSREGDWTQWAVFFLKAVVEQAEKNQFKAAAILNLYQEKKVEFAELTHSQYAIHALDFIFQRPVFRSSDFVARSKIPRPTAMRITKLLRDRGIIKTFRAARGRRSGILGFPALLNIAEGEKLF